MSLNSMTQSKRSPEINFIYFLSISCVLMYLFRIFMSGTLHYFFMPWNLFLGFVPLFFSRLVLHHERIRSSKWMLLAVAILWLLFFPNAPYMLTDLFHLNSRPAMPLWYDLLFILTFAWTGLLAGFLSLYDIEKLLMQRQRISKEQIPYISGALLFIASFGIYLGRYLRWNSWDLFVDPLAIFSDVLDRFIHPFEHSQTWGMTFLMGFFLNVVYHSLRFLRR